MSRDSTNFLGRKKYSGSFRLTVPFLQPDTVVLNENNANDNCYLCIKNVGTSLVWIAFGQRDAGTNGFPLAPNEYILFDDYDNCPNDRVTATAEIADTVVAVVRVGYSLQ